MGTIITAASVMWASNTVPPPLVKAALLGLIVLALILTIIDAISYWKTRPRRFRLNSHRIKNYMVKWLSSGGRSAVFSRDLSWADKEVDDLLQKKAQKGELIIFAGRRTDMLAGLVNLGAEVYDYSSLNFEPRARFTIVDYGKEGARLAIGFPEDSTHVIYEYGPRSQAMMALAVDLVSLARSVPRMKAP
jgi:hypothetical protein